ncbi:hypothetical protein VULLAG_LOCUS20053 [Vulpes lagopus]
MTSRSNAWLPLPRDQPPAFPQPGNPTCSCSVVRSQTSYLLLMDQTQQEAKSMEAIYVVDTDETPGRE